MLAADAEYEPAWHDPHEYVPQPVHEPALFVGLNVVHAALVAPPVENKPAAHAAPLGAPDVDPATQ